MNLPVEARLAGVDEEGDAEQLLEDGGNNHEGEPLSGRLVVS
jgi:hypothetical protein